MRNLLLVFLLILSVSSPAQKKPLKALKYPSLLWEITGPGMRKPSYLFGTMHVSNKMVFHLSDSFYLGLKNADVVALETNPGNWQEDFSRYDMDNPYNRFQRGDRTSPSDYLNINSFKAFPYEKFLEKALYSSPSILNNFLYRSNSEMSSDFEEDTYLDLYIYQVGRKWKKKVCGVEDFDESMSLMKQAYADAAKDKKTKQKSYDPDEEFGMSRMEEAYRTGNLDLLDTINKVNSTSAAFDEKFLYRRNEIQARSIDSILKTKATLFAGVGAAHLPGQRGVIELLRRMGYTLRPIRMKERDSKHKEEIESIRVPVSFGLQSAEDKMFSVQLPGKLYQFGTNFGVVQQWQYADMSNGSYYMVSRIYTNAALWGHSPAMVQRKIDSVLYENIPGKILSKQSISRNGYNGYDIVNRTRRGDYQRYHIFITPFEVLLFKMSGNGDYVKLGTEASQFFNSIQLKEFKTDWKVWSPHLGGFSVDMPHQPYVVKGGSVHYLATDKSTNTSYEIFRTDNHNFDYVEEDSFELQLVEESFGSSGFIARRIDMQSGSKNGYAYLQARYKAKDSSICLARYFVRGPHYYAVVTKGATEQPRMRAFIQSFNPQPYTYAASKKYTDTSLYFTVNSPVPLNKEVKLSFYPEEMLSYGGVSKDEDEVFDESGTWRNKLVEADSTGEKIYITFFKPGRYYFDDDTTAATDTLHFKTSTQDWIYRSRKKYISSEKWKVLEYELGDSLSSRMVKGKFMTRNGIRYRLEAELDTLSRPSAFIQDFFSSFQPSDTVKGVNPLERKTALLAKDFFSGDSLLHKRAIKNIGEIDPDSSDLVHVQQIMKGLTWKEKKYLDTKVALVSRISNITTAAASDYLSSIYYAAGDTVDLQYAALEALLQQKTAYAYRSFRDIMINEPPVLSSVSNNNYTRTVRMSAPFSTRARSRDFEDVAVTTEDANGNFLDELKDTLQLTRGIFKDILPLINLNDYEKPMLDLLEQLVDSNMLSGKDYEMYYAKFILEAKQEMKKQLIREKTRSIEKAQKDPDEKEDSYYGNNDKDYGNSKLDSYATLLMPFWEQQPAVQALFRQMLNSNDKRLRYQTALLLIRNKKPLADSVLLSLARDNDFRYELYYDLHRLNRLELFPVSEKDDIKLATSELMSMGSYSSPDTVAYIDRLPHHYKGRDGYVYFFRYKKKKDDIGWKIASVGLVPARDGYLFPFKAAQDEDEDDDYNFTELHDKKLDEEEPVREQLQRVLKRQTFAKRKSARRYYDDEDAYDRLTATEITD